MNLKALVLAGLTVTTGWQAQSYPLNQPNTGGVLHGSLDPTPDQQIAISQANLRYQKQQIIDSAQQAAVQATAYAKEAALYRNAAASQAAVYAAQAAHYAELAAGKATFMSPSESQMTTEQAAAAAHQAAANAKQAAGQAGMDSEVERLKDERDQAIGSARAKYAAFIPGLQRDLSDLQQKGADLSGQMTQADRDNARLQARQLYQPKDPWRMLDGKVCSAKEDSWLRFTGIILEVRTDGILLHGDFGPPLQAGFGARDYFVENFPIDTYPMADKESITADMNFVAHLAEKASIYRITNSSTDLHVNTVRKLDYGQIITNPPPDLAQKWNPILLTGTADSELARKIKENQDKITAIEMKLQELDRDMDRASAPIIAEYKAKIKDLPNQLARRAKEADDAKKQAVVDRVLKNNQDLADKGDPYGLLRMGERYRDGEGVPKDLAKAKDYLQKAAAAGSPTAADELAKLTAQ